MPSIALQTAERTANITIEATNLSEAIIAVVQEFLLGAEVNPITVNNISSLLRTALMPAALLVAKYKLYDAAENESLRDYVDQFQIAADTFGLTFLGLNLFVGDFKRTASGGAEVGAVLAIATASGLNAFLDAKYLHQLDKYDEEASGLTPGEYAAFRQRVASEFSHCFSLAKIITASVFSSAGTFSGISAVITATIGLINRTAASNVINYGTWPFIAASATYAALKLVADYRAVSPAATLEEHKKNIAYREKLDNFERILSGICWLALRITTEIGSGNTTLLTTCISWAAQAVTTLYTTSRMAVDIQASVEQNDTNAVYITINDDNANYTPIEDVKDIEQGVAVNNTDKWLERKKVEQAKNASKGTIPECVVNINTTHGTRNSEEEPLLHKHERRLSNP
jgi:hypothetical protein